MTQIFIDGSAGTTGLRIHERFAGRGGFQLIQPEERLRKDPQVRKECIAGADLAFLCLPDAAARESVALAADIGTRIIDTSTAHRTNPDWAYGFPELSPAHREKIENGNRIAVPGCHATGFHSIVYPLVSGGLMPADYPVVCYSVTGYSGGGKQMIAQYEAPGRAPLLDAPRQYGLAQAHKHLPEMQAVSGLVHPPVFSPILSDYYSGMTVTVPLFPRLMAKQVTVKDIHQYLSDYYGNGGLVRVMPLGYEAEYGGMVPGNYKSGQDDMELWVYGQDDRILVASCFDNLGKGASGAAVQCMNLMLGLDEAEGLQVTGNGKEG